MRQFFAYLFDSFLMGKLFLSLLFKLSGKIIPFGVIFCVLYGRI